MSPSSPIVPKSFAFEGTSNGIPGVIIQVTELVRSYMIWAGTTDVDVTPDAIDQRTIERLVAAQGSLAKDWSCAMPPTAPGTVPAGTPLFRSTSEDVSLPMAQRLARRFNKQIFLSVDAPNSFGNPGQSSHVILRIEKLLVQTLVDLEKVQSKSS